MVLNQWSPLASHSEAPFSSHPFLHHNVQTGLHPQNRKYISQRCQRRNVPGHRQHAQKIWWHLNKWFVRYVNRETNSQTYRHDQHNTPLYYSGGVMQSCTILVYFWTWGYSTVIFCRSYLCITFYGFTLDFAEKRNDSNEKKIIDWLVEKEAMCWCSDVVFLVLQCHHV